MSKRLSDTSDTIKSDSSKKQRLEDTAKATSSKSDKLTLVPTTPPVSKTHSALLTIRSLFPVKRFFNKLPPIIMWHQIYDLMPSRTTVDREIRSLQTMGKICIFKLGVEILARAVILTEDLFETAKICFPDNTLIEKFLKFVIPLAVIDIDKSFMEKSFSLKEIRELMHCGYLVFSNENGYLLSFPNAGHFMKAYSRGRKVIVQLVKKSKHGEILQNEIESRNLEKTVVLGIRYHIHDVVGADLVLSVDTTSGRILRFNKVIKQCANC